MVGPQEADGSPSAGDSDVGAGQSEGDAELASAEDIETQHRLQALVDLLGIEALIQGTNNDQGGDSSGD